VVQIMEPNGSPPSGRVRQSDFHSAKLEVDVSCVVSTLTIETTSRKELSASLSQRQ
jgi:hypothetical protein